MRYKNDEIKSIDDLRSLFPGGEANALNWCVFSTSGVHGSYIDLDEIEHSLKNKLSDDQYDYVPPRITVLVIKPRMVTLGYGHIDISLDDIPFLRKLAKTSLAAIKESQVGNM